MDDEMPAVGRADARATRATARNGWRARIAPVSLLIAAAFVVIDQLTKHWALNALTNDREIHVIWTLQWNLAFNTGMAFSRGQGLGPVIAVLALFIVVVLVISTAHVEGRLARVAAGMLIGGALGNLIDRLFRGDAWLHGAVVDFIDFQWFPIFNVADIGVTVGAVLFGIASVFGGALREPAPATAGTTTDAPADTTTIDTTDDTIDTIDAIDDTIDTIDTTTNTTTDTRP